MREPIQYARSGDLRIAYQVVGDGPMDLVFVAGWVSNIGMMWDNPLIARFLNRLSSFSRLILFDKRSTGMSDRDASVPTLEERMDDVRAVMDAGGSRSAALMGSSEGGAMSMLFAATYPERTDALILFGTFAKRIWSPDYPWAPTPEQRQAFFDQVEQHWHEDMDLYTIAPSIANDPVQKTYWGNYMRMSASPSTALATAKLNTDIDVRHVLPAIRVPTLVMHRTGDLDTNVEEGRWIASQIEGARFVELVGGDHFLFAGDSEPILSEIEEMLTGTKHPPQLDRVLATVLFTDIVGSTRLADEMGDRAWRELLQQHNEAVSRLVASHRGKLIKFTGDGALATFDGPGRAVSCGLAIVRAVKAMGLDVRAGLHTGEIEMLGDDVTGLSVHIASRVVDVAGAGETVASRTVRDLTSGSGHQFVNLGERNLSGVADPIQVFTVTE